MRTLIVHMHPNDQQSPFYLMTRIVQSHYNLFIVFFINGFASNPNNKNKIVSIVKY